MKFLPLVVVGMYPGLYARAVETITNMTRANYFYIIGYGNYSGYRVEHDPTLTLYMTTSTTSLSLPPWVGIGIIVGSRNHNHCKLSNSITSKKTRNI